VRQDSELLGVLVGVLRWGVGGTGYCADCNTFARRRAIMQPFVELPPDRLVRLHVIAPNTRAESAGVDDYLRAYMNDQLAGVMRVWPARRLCQTCAKQLCDQHQRNDTGTLSGEIATFLATRQVSMWTGLFLVCEVGHGKPLQRFLTNAVGPIPRPDHLLKRALATWTARPRADVVHSL
jgi:hypothetical protein